MTLSDLKQEVDKAIEDCGGIDKASKIQLIEQHEGEMIDVLISIGIGNKSAVVEII